MRVSLASWPIAQEAKNLRVLLRDRIRYFLMQQHHYFIILVYCINGTIIVNRMPSVEAI